MNKPYQILSNHHDYNKVGDLLVLYKSSHQSQTGHLIFYWQLDQQLHQNNGYFDEGSLILIKKCYRYH